jgi:hypothetical protein
MKKYCWLEAPLQGLAYWIGYRRQLYRHHDLPEAAIVSEFVTLILAHRRVLEGVVCEKSYKSLGVTQDKTRADIVIMEDDKPRAVIEVKRYGSDISKDIERLSYVKKAHPEIDCLLLVAAQSKLPTRLVDPDTGKSRRGKIVNGEFSARIIRVSKAAHSFDKKKLANYVCLLEIH